MVIPRVLSRGTVPAAQKAHFKAYCPPRPSCRRHLQQPVLRLRHQGRPLLRLRAEHPNLVGFKEFGGPDDLRYAASTSPAATTA